MGWKCVEKKILQSVKVRLKATDLTDLRLSKMGNRQKISIVELQSKKILEFGWCKWGNLLNDLSKLLKIQSLKQPHLTVLTSLF